MAVLRPHNNHRECSENRRIATEEPPANPHIDSLKCPHASESRRVAGAHMTKSSNVVGFPRDHVRTLMLVARTQARSLGHDLGRWAAPPKAWPWVRYAYCKECGAYAKIESKSIDSKKLSDYLAAKGSAALLKNARSFLTDEPSLDGDALLEACPSPHAPWNPFHQRRLGERRSARRRAPTRGQHRPPDPENDRRDK